MNMPSEDIKDMLEAESSLGLAFQTNLFIAREPADPNNCVTIFDTPGFPPMITYDKAKYEYPSIQIRVRNTSYQDGMELAQNIADYLHLKSQETWNNTYYTIIKCMGNPALLDWDENKRARIIINFNLQRR